MKNTQSLPILNAHVAGIDVGSQRMFVSVGGQAPKVYGCCTADLCELRDWLLAEKVTSVAMEATGVYWLCLYGILEEARIEALVVNGAHVKSLPGRKSDMKDCQWLATLHSRGLLRSGFVPGAEVRRLRDYQRLRSDLVTMASTHVQHMQKALERLNLKIHTVISSIIGVSGLRLIRAIIDGQRDADALLKLCDAQILEKKAGRLRRALEGNWQPEHLFALALALESWDFYQKQIERCDAELAIRIAELAKDKPVPSLAPKKELRNNAPKKQPQLQQHMAQIFGADVSQIPGLNCYTAMLLSTEVGWDMSRWKSVKEFTAWLGVAPATRQSGSRKRNEKRHLGRAGRIFCLAAQSMASAKNSWLAAFYRRIRATRGGPVAIKATARKIAQLFYLVLTKGWAYVEQGIAEYEKRYRETQLRRLKALARELGVILETSAPKV